MTPTNLWIRSAPLASLLMIASCAASPPISAPRPRLPLPPAATTPCLLRRLPDRPTLADLEIVYAALGGDLVACDAARRLAVETLVAERALQDRWRAEREGADGRP